MWKRTTNKCNLCVTGSSGTNEDVRVFGGWFPSVQVQVLSFYGVLKDSTLRNTYAPSVMKSEVGGKYPSLPSQLLHEKLRLFTSVL